MGLSCDTDTTNNAPTDAKTFKDSMDIGWRQIPLPGPGYNAFLTSVFILQTYPVGPKEVPLINYLDSDSESGSR